MIENSLYDKKSLQSIIKKNADWNEVAKDCVAFSNAQGGMIEFGIEDNSEVPPIGQRISKELPTTLTNKVKSKTINVATHTEIKSYDNGAQTLCLHIHRSIPIASTTSGKYFLRIGDNSIPITGEDIHRVISEKGFFQWETQPTMWSWKEADKEKLEALLDSLRTSERLSHFIQQKETKEILNHFFLTEEESDLMTNLGVLFIGTQSQRGRIMNAPAIQCIKYDENGEKVKKYLWDDYSMTPKEIIEDVWARIPDWKETTEISDGLFRREILAYEKEVIRELICNALVHRPYTIKGDIFISIYPDRVEITNPGTLPLGVTPNNILHKTVKRNEHFANLCYALQLMEKEGSGYDKIYEIQLSNGKLIPKVIEGEDSVKAIVERRIISKEAIKVIKVALDNTDLKQKQIICLGLIAQHESLSATSLIKLLSLKDSKALSPWLKPLIDSGIVQSTGKFRSKEYRINIDILRNSEYKGKTTLKRIEDYRIKELIMEDLKIYNCAPLKDIHQRIGKEIPYKRVLSQIKALVKEELVEEVGANRWVKYRILEK